jgi:hypothetical protein
VSDADIINSLNFGRSEDILKNTSDNPMTELLLKLTNELIADWRKQLETPNSKGHKPYATGKLAQSLEPLKLSENLIATTAENHWKYINYGVNGTVINRGAPTHGRAPKGDLSFYDAIYKWIGDKGIVPKDKGITREQLAGMIVNSVRMKGIEATHFFDKVLTEQRVDEMSQRVSDLVGAAIKIVIKKPK